MQLFSVIVGRFWPIFTKFLHIFGLSNLKIGSKIRERQKKKQVITSKDGEIFVKNWLCGILSFKQNQIFSFLQNFYIFTRKHYPVLRKPGIHISSSNLHTGVHIIGSINRAQNYIDQKCKEQKNTRGIFCGYKKKDFVFELIFYTSSAAIARDPVIHEIQRDFREISIICSFQETTQTDPAKYQHLRDNAATSKKL